MVHIGVLHVLLHNATAKLFVTNSESFAFQFAVHFFGSNCEALLFVRLSAAIFLVDELSGTSLGDFRVD
jgi:hypothetical protein